MRSAIPGTYSGVVSKTTAATTSATARASVARAAVTASEGRDLLQRVGDDRAPVVHGGAGGQEEAVLRDRVSERLDIVGESMVAPIQGGEPLGGSEQEQGCARAGAKLDPEVLARRGAERHDVPPQRLGSMDGGDRRLGREDRADVRDRLEVVDDVA